jgi:hypothetical protein
MSIFTTPATGHGFEADQARFGIHLYTNAAAGLKAASLVGKETMPMVKDQLTAER